MKAVVCAKYGPPEVLRLAEVKKPVPKDNEILISIRATTVTASDVIIRGLKVSGMYKVLMRLVIGFSGPRKPILGMTLAGEVEAIGKSVTSFKPGDHVFGFNRFGFGAYAEYACWPESRPISLMPANLTFEEASAIPFGGLLAMFYIKKMAIQSGQKVLVYGASGAVGTAAVQLARYYGAEVTGVCGTSNLELVRSIGAEKVIDYTKNDMVATDEKYDLIFDAAGKNKTSAFKTLLKERLTSDGTYLSIDDGTPKLMKADLVSIKEMIEAGKFKPVIDRVYPIEEIVEAHRYVETGHKKGNVVITV